MIRDFFARRAQLRRHRRIWHEQLTLVLGALPTNPDYRKPIERITALTGLERTTALIALGYGKMRGWVIEDTLSRIHAYGRRELVESYYLTDAGCREIRRRLGL